MPSCHASSGAAEKLRCARPPHSAWYWSREVEMLTVELCMLLVRTLQVSCSAAVFCTSHGRTHLWPSSERRIALQISLLCGRRALRR